jgi:transcriptional regulator with XRE-family HTH domain
LRARRKAQELTQAALAVRAGIGITALRSAERGQGRLGSFARLLTALGLELRGRTLMAGPVGPALATARQKRRQSRRGVARALGVSRNTHAAIEGGVGLLSALEAYGAAIGAGLYLGAENDERTFYAHAGNSSADHGWETPAALATVLMQAAGGFDLDPCAATTDKRRARVKARLLLTAEDDGLVVPWRGKVFVNPPYGRSLKAWARKCAGEAANGGAVVVGLLPARPDTRWWHDHIAGQAHVFMLRGRLQFGAGENSAPFPSAVVVWGEVREMIARLADALPEAWHIPSFRT